MLFATFNRLKIGGVNYFIQTCRYYVYSIYAVRCNTISTDEIHIYTQAPLSPFPWDYDMSMICTHAAASPENWKSDNTLSCHIIGRCVLSVVVIHFPNWTHFRIVRNAKDVGRQSSLSEYGTVDWARLVPKGPWKMRMWRQADIQWLKFWRDEWWR